jgi:hypothetical protein
VDENLCLGGGCRPPPERRVKDRRAIELLAGMQIKETNASQRGEKPFRTGPP